jgi:hypothetical protein
MNIDTNSDLLRLKHILEMEFGEFPENLIVVSKPILKECSEWMGKTNEIKNTSTCIRVFNIKVMRDVAEIF